jgi:hypothetical protein
MKKIILLFILIPMLMAFGKTQQQFDTTQFNKNFDFAKWMVEYEYFTQLATDSITRQPDNSVSEWFSYYENKCWHTIGGHCNGNTFSVTNHFITDSLFKVSEYKGYGDSSILNASGCALSNAESRFQLIRDTCRIYFNSFLYRNPDQTISVWFLPAFQPSGQAVYGCEWEYIFDKTGKILLNQKPYSNIITAVWIGQPRELWLNYRNTDQPTVGSLYFVESFRDYFTRIRIDTRTITCTIAKDKNGIYSWTYKNK